MYVFGEYCLQLIMYSVSTQGIVEYIINISYYYYHYLNSLSLSHTGWALHAITVIDFILMQNN